MVKRVEEELTPDCVQYIIEYLLLTGDYSTIVKCGRKWREAAIRKFVSLPIEEMGKLAIASNSSELTNIVLQRGRINIVSSVTGARTLKSIVDKAALSSLVAILVHPSMDERDIMCAYFAAVREMKSNGRGEARDVASLIALRANGASKEVLQRHVTRVSASPACASPARAFPICV